MKNRNMKQKITIAFGVVVICFFVTVGALFYGMINISTQYNQKQMHPNLANWALRAI